MASSAVLNVNLYGFENCRINTGRTTATERLIRLGQREPAGFSDD